MKWRRDQVSVISSGARTAAAVFLFHIDALETQTFNQRHVAAAVRAPLQMTDPWWQRRFITNDVDGKTGR